LATPAAEQAQGRRPTGGNGATRYRCAVYRASQRPYRAMFESVWGMQAFAIAWPGVVEQVCARPGTSAGEPMPVHLSSLDRGRVGANVRSNGASIANYEASAEVTNFYLEVRRCARR